MLVRTACLVLTVLLTFGCARQSDDVPEGGVALHMSQLDEENLSVLLINKSPAELEINGLFAIGYVQTAITYEIEDSKGLAKSKPQEISMPLLVDLEKYRVVLSPGGIYGAVIKKDDLAALYELPNSQCYKIRAIYRSPNKTYSSGVWRTNPRRFCF